jgi:hypothetical protein
MDQSIIKLFEGASCIFFGKDPNDHRLFKVGKGHSLTIEQIYKYHIKYEEEKQLKIVSIDLAGSKLGELLKEFDNKK